MEFTFWENESIKLPKGPLWGSLGFLGALVVLVTLGTVAGSIARDKSTASSGPTLEELQAIEKIVSSGDMKKIDEALTKDGQRIGADLSKWKLVSGWNSDLLTELYVTDLLTNVRGQIDTLKKQMEAEKAKAEGKKPGEAPPAEPAAE